MDLVDLTRLSIPMKVRRKGNMQQDVTIVTGDTSCASFRVVEFVSNDVKQIDQLSSCPLTTDSQMTLKFSKYRQTDIIQGFVE